MPHSGSTELAVATKLTLKIVDTALLRWRAEQELSTAIWHTKRLGFSWRRLQKDLAKVTLYIIFTDWQRWTDWQRYGRHQGAADIPGRNRRILPSRAGLVYDISAEVEFLDRLESRIDVEYYTIRQEIVRWRSQLYTLGLILKLRLVSDLQHRQVEDQHTLTEVLWWRIRSYLWIEAYNPVCAYQRQQQ